MKRVFLLLLAVACLPFLSGVSAAQDLLNDNIQLSGGTLHLKRYVENLGGFPASSELISMTTQPGGDALFVTSQTGEIFSVVDDGSGQGIPTLWFDYNTAVDAARSDATNGYVLEDPQGVHGGLRSVAFHPEFETNGKFYTSAMVDRPQGRPTGDGGGGDLPTGVTAIVAGAAQRYTDAANNYTLGTGWNDTAGTADTGQNGTFELTTTPNGTVAVANTGGGQDLAFSGGANLNGSGYTIQAVIRLDAGNTEARQGPIGFDDGGWSGAYLGTGAGDGTNLDVGAGNQGGARGRTGGVSRVQAPFTVAAGTWAIYTLSAGANGATATIDALDGSGGNLFTASFGAANSSTADYVGIGSAGVLFGGQRGTAAVNELTDEWRGAIADVAIYETQLSAADILINKAYFTETFFGPVVPGNPTDPTDPISDFNYIGNDDAGFDGESVIAEWTVNATGQVDLTSYRELFRVSMPVFDHPVKQIAFNNFAEPSDADYGLLYIAHGDGSVQSAIAGGGQNRDDGLGKILRVNPLASGSDPYTTPGNPFINDVSTLDEIYSLGHRNPHHISFALAADGSTQLIVAEGGRDNIEEVNLIQAGGDYGWSDREGTFVHRSSGGYLNGVSALPSNDYLNGYTYPSAQYDHDANPGQGFVGSIIGGGFVIDNNSDPDLQGQYIFCDFGSFNGNVFRASLADLVAAKTTLGPGELPSELSQATISRLTLTLDSNGDGNVNRSSDDLNTLFQINRNDIRFGRGSNGEMFITSKQTGNLYLVTNTISSFLLGDVNLDGVVNFLDISPFISLLSNGIFQEEADVNQDGAVNFLDISSFIGLLSS